MVIFYKKWYNLSMLHSMTIRLIYVHLLEPFNLCQMPTRGIWGQILIFMLIAISPLCYINIPAGFVSFQRHNGSSYCCCKLNTFLYMCCYLGYLKMWGLKNWTNFRPYRVLTRWELACVWDYKLNCWSLLFHDEVTYNDNLL